MEIINLGEKSSILNTFVAQLRDKETQKDSLRFRTNLERLGQIFGYEISKTLHGESRDVVTPLGTATLMVPNEKVVVSTILRAGLPLHEGVLSCIDSAENAFVAASANTTAKESSTSTRNTAHALSSQTKCSSSQTLCLLQVLQYK